MSPKCLPRSSLSLGCADCFHRSPKTETRTHPLHPAGTGGKLTMILRFTSTSHLFYSSRRSSACTSNIKAKNRQLQRLNYWWEKDGRSGPNQQRSFITKQQLFVSSTGKKQTCCCCWEMIRNLPKPFQIRDEGKKSYWRNFSAAEAFR